MGTVPIPISAPTCGFFLTVILANIATSIPYRQYCFAYHSCAVPIVGILHRSMCIVSFRKFSVLVILLQGVPVEATLRGKGAMGRDVARGSVVIPLIAGPGPARGR